MDKGIVMAMRCGYRRWNRLRRALWRDRRGGPLVEFALVMPVLMTLTFAILDFSYIAFADATLEGAVREAARRGITGYVPTGMTRDDYVRSRILDAMASFSIEGGVTITTRVYSRFSSIGEPEPFSDTNGNGIYDPGECFTDVNGNGSWDADMARDGLGGAGDVVVYEARVNLRTLTPLFQAFLGRTGMTMPLAAATAVRNEPYNLVIASGDGVEVCP